MKWLVFEFFLWWLKAKHSLTVAVSIKLTLLVEMDVAFINCVCCKESKNNFKFVDAV